MSTPFCILFAWPVGSSKTPIATYLSHTLGLPIFNNDAIRSEVMGDFGELREDIYLERRNTRLKATFEAWRSFILDASMDRAWEMIHEWMGRYGFSPFVISIDISGDFLQRLHGVKWAYGITEEQIRWYIVDHEKFLSEYPHEIHLRITDENFFGRLKNARQAVEKWIATNAYERNLDL